MKWQVRGEKPGGPVGITASTPAVRARPWISRAPESQGPVSLLRLVGQANIAAANRHHARDPQQTLKLHERLCCVPGGWPAVVRSPLRAPAALKTGTPGSAAVVEGHLVAVGVRERESAAERPVDGR